MSDMAIQVSGVRKSYEIYETPKDRLKQILFGRWKSYHKKFDVLKGISFDVKRGQCVGIIGKNGAGKSTLLQILAGTMSESGGTINVNGRVAAVLELGAGFNPDYAGRQNIYMYGSLFGLSTDEITKRMSQIEDFAGIGEFIDRPVKTYSSGMQARLAFAVIAHIDADILIIDEALSVGDAQFTQKCMRFLRAFKAKGSILFVSHDLGAVTGFCDEAIWIDNGFVKDRGTAKDVCEAYYAFMQGGQTDAINTTDSVPDDSNESTVPSRLFQYGVRREQHQTATMADASINQGLQQIKPFGFNLSSSSHGTGDAKILDVQFLRANGQTLDVCTGGQDVLIRIHIQAIRDVDSPIVGFIIKDRLGQPLLGGNTYYTYEHTPVSARKGQFWEVEFGFKLPILAVGDYSVVAAIGNGTLAEHFHLHWLHDALHFKVLATSIEGVLVGAPLDRISMTSYSME